MLSLRALQAAHKTLLIIDSSSARIQVGLYRANLSSAGVWENAEGDAGVAVFQNTDKLLKSNEVALNAVDAIAFCDGPGSVLGIRTAAVALRTWNVLRSRPLFAFTSLRVVAEGLAESRNGTPFSVIADARRETWHRVTVDPEGHCSPLERARSDQLQEPLIMPEGFRAWAVPPSPVETVHYRLAEWLSQVSDVGLFRPTENPDAFLHEEPTYQTWTPRVHQAPQ